MQWCCQENQGTAALGLSKSSMEDCNVTCQHHSQKLANFWSSTKAFPLLERMCDAVLVYYINNVSYRRRPLVSLAKRYDCCWNKELFKQPPAILHMFIKVTVLKSETHLWSQFVSCLCTLMCPWSSIQKALICWEKLGGIVKAWQKDWRRSSLHCRKFAISRTKYMSCNT